MDAVRSNIIIKVLKIGEYLLRNELISLADFISLSKFSSSSSFEISDHAESNNTKISSI